MSRRWQGKEVGSVRAALQMKKWVPRSRAAGRWDGGVESQAPVSQFQPSGVG